MTSSAYCSLPPRASFMARCQCSGDRVISRCSWTLRKYFQLRDNSNRLVWFLKCLSNGRLCQQKGEKHNVKESTICIHDCDGPDVFDCLRAGGLYAIQK